MSVEVLRLAKRRSSTRERCFEHTQSLWSDAVQRREFAFRSLRCMSEGPDARTMEGAEGGLAHSRG